MWEPLFERRLRTRASDIAAEDSGSHVPLRRAGSSLNFKPIFKEAL